MRRLKKKTGNQRIRPKTAFTRTARILICVGVMLVAGRPAGLAASSPNIIIILVDDMGYGDLGCFGHPTIRTPNLDRMASEGQKWTSFYAGATVCTPSRAALITGRHAIRSGLISDRAGNKKGHSKWLRVLVPILIRTSPLLRNAFGSHPTYNDNYSN